MSLLGKLFGVRAKPPDKTALAIDLFTQSAFLMVHPDDYKNDLTRQRRVVVFLFGALDAVLQHNRIVGSEKVVQLKAYLSRNFGTLRAAEIETTVSFLIDASRDPQWIPIMELGGQTFHDWAGGDTAAPSRLFNVVHGTPVFMRGKPVSYE